MTGLPGLPADMGSLPGRVVYVCTDPGVPVFGTKGCSVHAQAVLRELVSRCDDVHLVTVRPGGPAPAGLEGVVVHDLGRPSGTAAEREHAVLGRDAQAAQTLARLVEEAPIVLVYQRFSLFAAPAMELAQERGWPSVLEVNAPLIEEQARHRALVDRRGAEDLARRSLRAARYAYAVSPAVASWAHALSGVAVGVVGNGVDLRRFAGSERPPRGPADPLTLAFVGTFKPWHGLATLVAAAAATDADPACPRVRLLLVGDGPELAGVVEAATAVGLGERVLAPGAVPQDEVSALLAEADIALAPYGAGEQYFSPLKVFEYLAAGLPTVVSGIGELPRLLGGEQEALVVPPGDDGAFVAAVVALARDAARRRELGARAAVRARAEWGWGTVVDRVLRALDEAVTGPGAAAERGAA